MAINAYTGLMGSGKSFEVVASVILPAIEQGRRVVTNVDGINEEKIHAHLIAEKKADPDKLGRVIHVKNDDISTLGFFPDEETPDRKSIVMAGDLVAVDEAWRFWGQGAKIPPEHMQFFRMHRHYVHPDTKVACDVVLMVQSIGDLNRSLRAVVELTAVMTKLKTIGMNKGYRVELYEGGRTVKSAKFETFVKRYDKRIFPLYQSYSGGQGKERTIDKRQNVLKNPRIWLIVGGMAVMCSLSGYYLWWFFKGRMVKPESEKQAAAVASATPVTSGPPVAQVIPSDSSLRVAGEVYIGWKRYIALVDGGGRIRLESPGFFVGTGTMLQGEINGQKVATWTGAAVSASTSTGGVGK